MCREVRWQRKDHPPARADQKNTTNSTPGMWLPGPWSLAECAHLGLWAPPPCEGPLSGMRMRLGAAPGLRDGRSAAMAGRPGLLVKAPKGPTSMPRGRGRDSEPQCNQPQGQPGSAVANLRPSALERPLAWQVPGLDSRSAGSAERHEG